MTDLFETPELMPANLQAIVDKYAHADNSYEMCGAMLVECKAIGYTFDFYLDAMPYNLRPIKNNYEKQETN